MSQEKKGSFALALSIMKNYTLLFIIIIATFKPNVELFFSSLLFSNHKQSIYIKGTKGFLFYALFAARDGNNKHWEGRGESWALLCELKSNFIDEFFIQLKKINFFQQFFLCRKWIGEFKIISNWAMLHVLQLSMFWCITRNNEIIPCSE